MPFSPHSVKRKGYCPKMAQLPVIAADVLLKSGKIGANKGENRLICPRRFTCLGVVIQV